MPTAMAPILASTVNRDSLIRKLDLSEYEGNKRFIAGYANIAGIRDNQGEVVTLEALEKAWEKWKGNPDYCILTYLHSNLPLAKVWFEPVVDSDGNTHQSGMDERGLYLVAQVRDDVSIADEVWEKIETKEFGGYSIGGRNLDPQAPECKDDVCTRFITNLELYEVGIVDQPANRVSLFNMLKRDDLAKLAEVSNKFKERILTKGVIKISKTRGENCGKYQVLIESELIDPHPFETEDTRVVKEVVEGMEYITLFDHVLLRPFTALSAEETGHGGFDPSPPKKDEPKNQGETPLSESQKEEVIEEIEEPSKDDSEPSEAPIEESAADSEVENEAIAPLTMETLAADLARVIERLNEFEKMLGKTEKVEKSTNTPAEETPVEEVKSEAETKAEKIVEAVQEKIVEEQPTVTTQTTEEVKEIQVEAAVELEPKSKPPKEEKIETRGVATQVIEKPAELDLANVYTKVSWKEIQRIRDELRV